MNRSQATGLIAVLIAGLFVWGYVRDRNDEMSQLPCLNVPKVTSDGITEGIQKGITATGWKAIAAQPTNNLGYFVSARLTGPGMGNGSKAVWAVDDISSPGLVYPAEAFASEFSDWGSASDRRLFNASTPGVSEAKDCVG